VWHIAFTPDSRCRYRRGKAESNDVDIVITHPDLTSGDDRVKHFGQQLVRRLYDNGEIAGFSFCRAHETYTGLITHVMRAFVSAAVSLSNDGR
jgi:hypothetical protein